MCAQHVQVKGPRCQMHYYKGEGGVTESQMGPQGTKLFAMLP